MAAIGHEATRVEHLNDDGDVEIPAALRSDIFRRLEIMLIATDQNREPNIHVILAQRERIMGRLDGIAAMAAISDDGIFRVDLERGILSRVPDDEPAKPAKLPRQQRRANARKSS